MADTIESGDVGIMLPSGDGHYIFQKLSTPAAGDKVLLFPMPGDDYVLLKLATDVQVGEKVIIVPDGKGNYYAVE